VITPETDPANATTPADFVAMAKRCTLSQAEINFGANVIVAVEIARQNNTALSLDVMESEGEKMVMQVVFLDWGQKVESSFINKAVAVGWRYRIGQGFHRVAA
jgi:hypothetical protein